MIKNYTVLLVLAVSVVYAVEIRTENMESEGSTTVGDYTTIDLFMGCFVCLFVYKILAYSVFRYIYLT